MMQSVVLYSSPGGSDCAAVRRFLAGRGVPYIERDRSVPAVAGEAKRRYGRARRTYHHDRGADLVRHL